jgi:hypothetical protein
MIGQYDHFSHSFFLYYTESKSPLQVAAQNMGFALWVLIWVSNGSTIVFSTTILQQAKPPCQKNRK